jgi:putative FmdB family regulatory protein
MLKTMPLYDYQCSACGSVFETEHAMSARPSVKCVACGSSRTAKPFNAAGVQFKGSGFYVTDSRSTTEGKSAGIGESAKSESKSDSTTSSDNTPTLATTQA